MYSIQFTTWRDKNQIFFLSTNQVGSTLDMRVLCYSKKVIHRAPRDQCDYHVHFYISKFLGPQWKRYSRFADNTQGNSLLYIYIYIWTWVRQNGSGTSVPTMVVTTFRYTYIVDVPAIVCVLQFRWVFLLHSRSHDGVQHCQNCHKIWKWCSRSCVLLHGRMNAAMWYTYVDLGEGSSYRR